jgi:hypothetical protein
MTDTATAPGDAHMVREFLTAFSDLALKSLNGHPAPGVLQLSRKHPRAKDIVVSRYMLGDVDGMVSAAMAASTSEQNAWIEGRLVPLSLRGRGKFEDTICVFALVIDSDADKGKAWSPPPGVRPTLIIETSPGNYQYWFFFKEAISRDRARELGKRIQAATQTDADTGVPTQPYRIAGTMNYPDAEKIARGRVVVGTGLVVCDPSVTWTAEELEAVFPAPRGGRGAQGGGARTTKSAIDVNTPGFPADLRDIIVDGVPVGHRSIVFYWMVKGLRSDGYAAEQIFDCFLAHPDGIGQKYLNPRESGSPQRLEDEVRRAYAKKPQPRDPWGGLASAMAAIGPAATPPPPPPPGGSPGGPSPGASPSQALEGARATFRKWLGKKYDTDILDAVASAGAAERLGGDPLWLLFVSGSGNAKTETVQSLEGAGALVVSTITSEGALLSATGRSPGATGGLLRKIGARGLVVVKDLTSPLSMDGKVRGLVFAALREIHDGRWERNVGYMGGRTLPWAGRIVIVPPAPQPGMWRTKRSRRSVIVSSSFAVIRPSGAKRPLFRRSGTPEARR